MKHGLIKSAEDIEKLRVSGKILSDLLEFLGKNIRVGTTGLDLEKLACEFIQKNNTKPLFKGYCGYPAALCIAINEAAVHGIPNDVEFKEGDIVGIDAGVVYEGLGTDAAVTFPVGKVSDEAKNLLQTNQEALNAGIKKIRSGVQLREVSKAIQNAVEKNGFTVIRELTGHGVGYDVHEAPVVYNYVDDGEIQEDINLVLTPGMVLAIEPIITTGNGRIKTLKDGWTIVTRDGKLASQFEKTVVVTESGCEVLC